MERNPAFDPTRVIDMGTIEIPPLPPRTKWVDLFGIDPDYCDGKPVDEWLEENRGEA